MNRYRSWSQHCDDFDTLCQVRENPASLRAGAHDVVLDDTAGLVKFLDEHPQAVGGVPLYGGRQIRRLDEKIVAVPWSLLTG